MIFDFHTHIFPERIAPRTLEVLKQNIVDVQHCDTPTTYTDATVSGLRQSMSSSGVDSALVLPIATTPKQSGTINSFAAEINGQGGIYSLGSVHPKQERVRDELERIFQLGLRGIKLHPEYQNVYINEQATIEVLKICRELGLIVVMHAGEDVGMLPPPKSSPAMIYDAMQHVPDLRLVCAHMGSWNMWDDVERYLVGTSVYFDTSFSFGFMGKERFSYIINAHKNIVFGTDSPWGDQKTETEQVSSAVSDKALLDRVLYKNAVELLKI